MAKKKVAAKKRTTKGVGYVQYTSNNSGGGWWLDDKDWKALAKAGWIVEWVSKDKYLKKMLDADGRWLGCLAKRAKRKGLSLREAASEWERITGKSATDAGCACCGQPHDFTEYDAKGQYVTSGPNAEYVASW